MRHSGLFAVLALLLLAVPASAQVEEEPMTFPKRTAVPQVPCGPGDRPETDLQGRVPPADLLTGRAAQGYTCNLELVGNFRSPSAGTFEAYGDCAYYELAPGAGTMVMDVSDSAHPVPAGVLNSIAMLDPWEGLRANAKRKLLVSGSAYSSYLDIYDISGDCRKPKLLSSTDMAPAKGHEGWFAPDGMTYYMSTTGPRGVDTVFPIDISDPTKPKMLTTWGFGAQTHGGFTTEDGRTTFICRQETPPLDAMLVVDTSEVAERRAGPKHHVLATVGLQDNQWCQSSLRVTYGGKPFLIQYGERSGEEGCSHAAYNWASFAYPRIYDLADVRDPKLVSTALLQSALPEHCEEVKGEGAINQLGYSVHHCSVDRLYDPTILACDYFFAGMRVLDIRDPYHPVELGYYNTGTNAVTGTGARPVIRAERKEIWFVNDTGGFTVVRFRDGLWPFPGSARCPEFDDHYYAHYNPGSTCPTANLNGIGKPAPGGAASQAPAALKLTRLSLPRSVARGARARLTFTASRTGRVTVDVRRGSRRVVRRSLRVRAGRANLRLPRLRPGRYTVVVRAVGGRAHRRALVVSARRAGGA